MRNDPTIIAVLTVIGANDKGEECLVQGYRSPAMGGIEFMSARYQSFSHPRHFHETYVIGWVHNGRSACYYRGENHAVVPGQIIVIEPHEIHTGEMVDTQWQSYRALNPTVELMQKFFGSETIPHLGGPVVHSPSLVRRLEEIHGELQRPGNSLLAELWMGEALMEMAGLAEEFRPGEQDMPAEVRRVVEAMHDQPNGSFSLNGMADMTSYSPYHFLRLFRKGTGLPPHQYLLSLRIDRARRMMARGMTASDAAFAVGFTDQSHFTRHFKRLIGSPPGRFSEKQQFRSIP